MNTIAIALLLAAAVMDTPSQARTSPGIAEPAPAPAPAPLSLCTCYYTYDEECPKGFVCRNDYKPINCQRMKPKGGAYAGKCTQKAEQQQTRPCDATCNEKAVGVSVCAGESTADVARAFELWRRAMTEPALNGGGPIDPALAEQARSLPLTADCIDYVGWRTLAVLELCRGHAITDHTDDHHDELTEHVMTSLSGDTCRIHSGDSCIAALIAGLSQGPDAVDDHVQSIAGACPEGLPFASAGPGYEETPPLDAVTDRLRVTVEHLAATRTEVPEGTVKAAVRP